MYIEHFVLLAGAYNLGFFYCFVVRKKIFFLFYKCKNEKQIFYFVNTKTRNSVICLPAPSTRSGIPPVKDSEHLINHLQLSGDINI